MNNVPTCSYRACESPCHKLLNQKYAKLCLKHLTDQKNRKKASIKRKQNPEEEKVIEKRPKTDGVTDVSMSLTTSEEKERTREVTQTDKAKNTKKYQFPDGSQYTEIDEKSSTTLVREIERVKTEARLQFQMYLETEEKKFTDVAVFDELCDEHKEVSSPIMVDELKKKTEQPVVQLINDFKNSALSAQKYDIEELTRYEPEQEFPLPNALEMQERLETEKQLRYTRSPRFVYDYNLKKWRDFIKELILFGIVPSHWHIQPMSMYKREKTKDELDTERAYKILQDRNPEVYRNRDATLPNMDYELLYKCTLHLKDKDGTQVYRVRDVPVRVELYHGYDHYRNISPEFTNYFKQQKNCPLELLPKHLFPPDFHYNLEVNKKLQKLVPDNAPIITTEDMNNDTFLFHQFQECRRYVHNLQQQMRRNTHSFDYLDREALGKCQGYIQRGEQVMNQSDDVSNEKRRFDKLIGHTITNRDQYEKLFESFLRTGKKKKKHDW